jgi:hypothetical protein
MKPELERIYETTAEDESRSRLEPYRELILRWRRQGRTYRRIRALLVEKCSIKVSTMTVHEFVQRRSRPRTVQPESETELPGRAGIEPTPTPQPAELPTYTKLSPAESVQSRPSLQSFRNKPALEPKPAVLEEFHYDEDKPLTIDRTIKD